MSSFDLQELQRCEGVDTVIYRGSMSSTSDIAREKLANGTRTKMPMLVLCDLQTAGRGQPGNTWSSNAESLTFTWCVEEQSIPQKNRPLLPLIAGVCVCEALNALAINGGARLKWPNDVLIDRKKACGILVEKVSIGQHDSFLIGIGINVNQADANALQGSRSQQFPPCSLRMNLGNPIDIQWLLLDLIQRLWDSTLAENDWQEKCAAHLDFIGEKVNFKKPNGEVVKGFFRGIDETGRIAIETQSNSPEYFSSGHLSLRMNN